jgi:predicted secreted hydrolase
MPEPTTTPRPITLPGDDAPHDKLTEWWYYTGHLSAANGNAFGFEFVIFQIERQDVPVFYAAHIAITDHQRQEFHADQHTWTRVAPPGELDLGDDKVRLSTDGGSDTIHATVADYGIDLTVRPTKSPVLHNGNGIISFGPVGDSYYYSSTRLAVRGTLTDRGATSTVTGEAWKDRQWGNFIVSPGGGWDWYSVQLADGSEIMLFVLRDLLGKASPSYGTLVRPDGSAENLAPGTFDVTALGSWTSPATGTTYPSGWRFVAPDRQLKLTLQPVLRDQELNTVDSTGEIYWEGEVSVEGQAGGMPLAGKGYVELTGYAANRRP